jgi:sulfur-carrier protein
MEIHFYAGFRQVVGGKTISLDAVENCTILDLLGKIIEKYPAMQHKLFDEDGLLRAYIRIFVNGTDFTFLKDGLQTILQAGDTMDVFPPIGGGAI